jgi:acyl-homoserine lactone synthase
MKVHIVTRANRSLYARELEQMHRLRHEIFVDELGWSDLRSPDGIERDDFDCEEAVYLIAAEFGQVHGSVRLLPTWRRCMALECFPAWLNEGGFQPAPDIWEWTRWAPGTVRRPRSLIRSRGALIVAALEFAQSRGVQSYLTFCETKFVPQLVELGWEPRPLGLPRPFDQGSAIAVQWEVKDGQLDAARRMFRMKGPAAIEAPATFREFPLHTETMERFFSVQEPDELALLEAVLNRSPDEGGRIGRVETLQTMPVLGRA